MAVDNKSLGKFILDGIPPAARGVPQVEVIFDIDSNGIINVSAIDKATNNEQKITITAGSGLSEEEVEKMMDDAEKHAQEDAKRKETVEIKNQADSVVFSAEKLLRDFDDKLPEDAKKQTSELIEAVEKAKEGDDVQDIQSTAEVLAQHIQTLGGQMYEAPEGVAGDNAEPDNEPNEDVIDAEFTDA
jgi:molecular chaperone DnaK